MGCGVTTGSPPWGKAERATMVATVPLLFTSIDSPQPTHPATGAAIASALEVARRLDSANAGKSAAASKPRKFLSKAIVLRHLATVASEAYAAAKAHDAPGWKKRLGALCGAQWRTIEKSLPDWGLSVPELESYLKNWRPCQPK